MTEIRLSGTRTYPSDDFLSRLKDYNTYYQGQPEQLRTRKNKNGEIIIDGLLSIYWGLRTAIRLQVADDADVRLRPHNLEHEEKSSRNSLEIPGATVDLENAIWGKTRQRKGGARLVVPSGERKGSIDTEDKLKRINSVIMRKRGGRNLRHRASINGHVYNHQTSVFTPAFGSVTKVRISSSNDCNDVIVKLLNKFRVENPPDDFSFYIVKDTQELRELPRDEFPLLSRVLVGPNEKLGKLFIMERKMHKEITPEVAQYIKLDSSILQVFLKKFHEEEEKEVRKLRKRFELYRKVLNYRIQEAST